MEVADIVELCKVSEYDAGQIVMKLIGSGFNDMSDIRCATMEEIEAAGLSHEIAESLVCNLRERFRDHRRKSSIHNISTVLLESLRLSDNSMEPSPVVRRITKAATETPSGTDIQENCSLMEYDCIIEADDTASVMKYLAVVNHHFNEKTGGVLCPSSINPDKVSPQLSDSSKMQYIVKIKWALPMEAFTKKGCDPNEIAEWLSSKVPPADPDAMSSRQGIYQAVDLNVYKRLLKKALEKHQ